MEESNRNKRKKRKTRRCLDELRKKIHQSNDVCKTNKNIDTKSNKSKSNCIKSNYVTSNRLTMLKKTVRSETITRSQLCEIKDKKLKVKKNTEPITSKCCTKVDSALNKNKTVAKQDKYNLNDGSEEQFSPNMNNNYTINEEVQTPKSIILFSPENQKDEEIGKNEDGQSSLEILKISSSSSTSTSNSTIPKTFTDKICNDMERYIEQNFPHILESMATTVEKMKAELLKLCYEARCSSQTEYNVYSYKSSKKQYLSNSSPNDPFIQNPRDYVKYLDQARSQSQCSDFTPTINRSKSPPQSSDATPTINYLKSQSQCLESTPTINYLKSPSQSSDSTPTINYLKSQSQSSDSTPIINYLKSQSQSSDSTPIFSSMHSNNRGSESDTTISISSPVLWASSTSEVFDAPEYTYYPHRLN